MFAYRKKSTFLPALVIAGLLIFCGFSTLIAQQLEYASHPTRPFDFEQIRLELQVNPADSVVRGQATYTMKSLWDKTDKLIMDAHRIDIQRITVGNQNAQFELHNDSLIITFPRPLDTNQEAKMQIVYEASPGYAWQVCSNGTIFSSFFPERRAYLFPIIDNPHVTARFDLDIKVPDSLQVVTNGLMTARDTVEGSTRLCQWSTKNAIPVTDWGIAIGQFDHSSFNVNKDQITIYNAKGLLTENQRKTLLQTAEEQIQSIEKFIGGTFPFSSLNVIVLPDHRWEMKNYGAGYGYLFMNRGDLTAQLRRIIDAQWAGVKIRNSRFIEADPQILIQTWMANQLGQGETDTLSLHDSPPHNPSMYADFSVANWNRWLHYFRDSSDNHLRQILNEQMPKILKTQSGVFDWSDFNRLWYTSKGRWFDLPVPQNISRASRLAYQIDYNYKPANNNLQLIIKPVKGYSMELITLPLVLDGMNDHKLTTVTFSGVGDTLSVQAVSSLKNAYVQVPDSMNLSVNEYKPVSFWLYQLRTTNDTVQKLLAIKALGSVQQNPDLQLAMLDFLKNAKDSEIRTALIQSLGSLTSGATGTSQIFIDAASDSSDSMRTAAAVALERYPGNEQVISLLQHLVISDQSMIVRRKAVRSLQQVDQANHFLSFVKDLVSKNVAKPMADVILPELVQNGDTTAAVALAKRYVKEPGPYHIRLQSFRLLQKYNNLAGDWVPIVDQMIEDNDPRIRFLGWQQANKLAPNVKRAMIERYAPDENDARVINVIRGLKDNESRTIIKQE